MTGSCDFGFSSISVLRIVVTRDLNDSTAEVSIIQNQGPNFFKVQTLNFSNSNCSQILNDSLATVWFNTQQVSIVFRTNDSFQCSQVVSSTTCSAIIDVTNSDFMSSTELDASKVGITILQSAQIQTDTRSFHGRQSEVVGWRTRSNWVSRQSTETIFTFISCHGVDQALVNDNSAFNRSSLANAVNFSELNVSQVKYITFFRVQPQISRTTSMTSHFIDISQGLSTNFDVFVSSSRFQLFNASQFQTADIEVACALDNVVSSNTFFVSRFSTTNFFDGIEISAISQSNSSCGGGSFFAVTNLQNFNVRNFVKSS